MVFDITLISLVYPNGTVPVVGMLVTPIRERSDDMKSATVLYGGSGSSGEHYGQRGRGS